MSIKSMIFIALGLAFLYGLFTIGFPFLLAMIVAIFIEPANQLLMKYARMNRIAAATINASLFLLALLGMAFLIGLKIFTELSVLFHKAPEYFRKIAFYIQTELMDSTQQFIDQFSLENGESFRETVQTGTRSLTSALLEFANVLSRLFFDFAKEIPNLFVFSIVFAVAVYLFSYSLPVLKGSFLSLFEEKSRDKVDSVLQNLRSSIFGFMIAQFILSSLTYVIALLGLMILGVKYALAIALLIVIVDILPILGTGSFLVPWAIYNIIIGNYFLAIGLIILFLFITVFRRIVEPKILGDAIGIGALPALISLYVGFKLVGVIGLFLGPIVVIIYQAMRKVGLFSIKIRLE